MLNHVQAPARDPRARHRAPRSAGPASAAGLEAAATPASQPTLLDYDGSTIVTYRQANPISSTQTTRFVVDGPFT